VRQLTSSHADADDRTIRKAVATVHTKSMRSTSTSEGAKKNPLRGASKHEDAASSTHSLSSTSSTSSNKGHHESKKDSGDMFSFLDPLGPSATATSQSIKMANGSTHTPTPRGDFPGLGFTGGGLPTSGTPQSNASFPGLMGGGGSGGVTPARQQPESFDGLLGLSAGGGGGGGGDTKRSGDIMSLFSQPGAKADPFANLKI